MTIKTTILPEAVTWFADFLFELGCNAEAVIEETSPAFHEVYFDKYEPKAYLFNDVYVVRPYYSGPEIEFQKLPNFENKVTGLKLYWGKHVMKDVISSIPIEDVEEFRHLVRSKVKN